MDRYESLFKHYGERFHVPWTLLESMAHIAQLYTDHPDYIGMMGISQRIYTNHVGVKFRLYNPECNIEVAANQVAVLCNRFADIHDSLNHYRFVLTAFRESSEMVYNAMRLAREEEGLPSSYKHWRAAGKPLGQWAEWSYTKTFFQLTEESNTLEYVESVIHCWSTMAQTA